MGKFTEAGEVVCDCGRTLRVTKDIVSVWCCDCKSWHTVPPDTVTETEGGRWGTEASIR